LAGGGCIERLPQRVQDALGELAGAAKEGLVALSVGVGLGVLHELMEAEVEERLLARRAFTIRIAPRSGMAMRTARSRWVGGASR
jgi:hypothetical protein